MGRWCAQCRGLLHTDGRSRHILRVVFGRSNALIEGHGLPGSAGSGLDPGLRQALPGTAWRGPHLRSSVMPSNSPGSPLSIYFNIEPTQFSALHFARNSRAMAKEAQAALQTDELEAVAGTI